MTVNKVILIGNLGADPEGRSTQSGMQVANLRLATSEREKRQGEWQDHTEWHRVVCFGRTAENVIKYCNKGKSIYVEGKIRTNKWTDREGRDRYTTEVIADTIRFLGGRSGGSAGSSGGASYGGGSPTYDADAGAGQDSGTGSYDNQGADDDIPF